MIGHALPLIALVLVSGCATVVEGSNQSVSIATAPPGASCTIDRAGERLGSVGMTPGSLRISKSKNDLEIACGKDGYQQASIRQSPKFVGTTFGNLIVGGVIGAVVDAASGANYVYPNEVHLDLAPAVPPVAMAPTQHVIPTSAGMAPAPRVTPR